MTEKNYIDVMHLAALRCAESCLRKLTGALLANEEEKEMLVESYKNIDNLIESIRKRVKIK